MAKYLEKILQSGHTAREILAKISKKLKKFPNLRPKDYRLQRKISYGTGPGVGSDPIIVKTLFLFSSYGYQQWSISFSRSDKALGVYLVWRNPSDGMRVFLDFSITLLNREHFTDNQTFTTQKAKFTKDAQCESYLNMFYF